MQLHERNISSIHTNQNFVVNNDSETDIKHWLFADIFQFPFRVEFAQEITLSWAY